MKRKIMLFMMTFVCVFSLSFTHINAYDAKTSAGAGVTNPTSNSIGDFFSGIGDWITGTKRYDKLDYDLASQALGVSVSELVDEGETVPVNDTDTAKANDTMKDFMSNLEFSITDPLNSAAKEASWGVTKFIVQLLSIGDDFFTITGYSGLHPVFSNQYVSTFAEFFSGVTWCLFLFGVVLGCLEEAIRYSNGQGSFSTLAMNILKGLIYTCAFQFVSTSFYNISVTTGEALANAVSQNSSGSINTVASTASAFTSMASLVLGILKIAIGSGNFMIILAMVFGVVYLVVKAAFFMAKKIPQFLTMMAKGSVMSFFVARGNNSTINSYLIQLGMFYVQIILQFTLIMLGISMIADGLTGNATSWSAGLTTKTIVGICLMASANEVGGWLGGLSGEDDLGKAIHTLSHGVDIASKVLPASIPSTSSVASGIASDTAAAIGG